MDEDKLQDEAVVGIAVGVIPKAKKFSLREIRRRADDIINRELFKLIDGEHVEPYMRHLLSEWVEQRQRNKGRPSSVAKNGVVAQYWCDVKRSCPNDKLESIHKRVEDMFGITRRRLLQILDRHLTASER